MPIQTKAAGTTVFCTITGRFDAHETPVFRSSIDEFMAQGGDGALQLRVTLSETTFIDSSGLAELVRAMKVLKAGGGKVVLVEPSDPVRVILELTRLDTTFEIEQTAPVAHEAV